MKKRLKSFLKKILPVDYCRTMAVFHRDAKRILAHSAAFNWRNKVTLEAQIILRYHVLEKGITMPKRRMPFGSKIAKELAMHIDKFESNYGITDQVNHGIKVLKEYYGVHRAADIFVGADFDYLEGFLKRHEVLSSVQHHYTRKEYYECKNQSFPGFSKWRHTIRNYSSVPVNEEKIKAAVELAISAPSACNRQHVRVHCISDKLVGKQILELQGGNRGFGHLADKVLILTADLRAEIGGVRERYDPYVNGGIFLMNLCYALSYCEVAHCILTYAIDENNDKKIRVLAKLPDNEVVVAMLCCGEPADEFDVAISPKRSVDEVLSFVR